MPTPATRKATPDPKPGAAKRAARVRAEGVTVRAPRSKSTTPVVTPEAAAVIDTLASELAAPAESRLERLRLAKLEHATLQAWIKDGEKPPRPATPNLDAVNAEHAAGGGRPRSKRATTKHEAVTPVSVQFTHDGKPMGAKQNKVSSLAFQFTKGIGGADVKRITTAELRAILTAAGVSDPNHTEWTVTLPNGVVLAAVKP